MTEEDDTFGAAWDRMSDAAGSEHTDDPASEHGHDHDHGGEPQEVGPPIRVILVVRGERMPVAPWPLGWNVGAAEPVDGNITMLFEHDAHESPVLQLAAITGLLGTVKAAQMDLVWWTLQTRGLFPGERDEPVGDLEAEMAEFLRSQEDTPGHIDADDDDLRALDD